MIFESDSDLCYKFDFNVPFYGLIGSCMTFLYFFQNSDFFYEYLWIKCWRLDNFFANVKTWLSKPWFLWLFFFLAEITIWCSNQISDFFHGFRISFWLCDDFFTNTNRILTFWWLSHKFQGLILKITDFCHFFLSCSNHDTVFKLKCWLLYWSLNQILTFLWLFRKLRISLIFYCSKIMTFSCLDQISDLFKKI